MNPNYPNIAQRATHRCEYCRAPEIVFNSRFEIDHIVASSKGGSDDDSNLALACRSCNLAKSDHLFGGEEDNDSSTPLFNPRNDQWNEHFQLDEDSGAIHGLTPIGKVTVIRLQMNSDNQVLARQIWIRLGLFP